MRSMIEVLAGGLAKLDPGAFCSIADFVGSRQNPDGGFRGRGQVSDLYYTVFGLACARSLGLSLASDKVVPYLTSFRNGSDLDFVHLTCLARCWGMASPEELQEPGRQQILMQLNRYQAGDGGFNRLPGQSQGFIYESFLAVQACQGLNAPVPRPAELCQSLLQFRTSDQAFANVQNLELGTTTVTAAAVVLLRHFGREIPRNLAEWLMARLIPAGGFVANPEIRLPDLLSTATALHALAVMGKSEAIPREALLHFVESLWDATGGFCGHRADPTPDCEYTFYGLLALGHLLA